MMLFSGESLLVFHNPDRLELLFGTRDHSVDSASVWLARLAQPPRHLAMRTTADGTCDTCTPQPQLYLQRGTAESEGLPLS